MKQHNEPTQLLGLALALLAVPAPQEDRAEDPLAHDLALPALEQLASWSQKHSLYGKRSEVYEVILRLDPEHSRARRGLKHRKQKGTWTAPEKPYRPKNKNAAALEAFPARRVELLAPYCGAVVRALDERGLRVTDAEAQQALTRALAASPDDPAIRALLCDVQVTDGWMMAESARAALHRDQLAALVESALARAEVRVEDDQHLPDEAELGAPWRAAAVAGHVRVLGTGTRDEARRAAQLQFAADDFIASLFRLRSRCTEETALYLLADGEQYGFLAEVPGLSRSQREFYAGLSGVQLPGDYRVAQWGVDERHRVDAVTRLRIDHLLHEEFGLEDRDGWVFEGLGGYLSARLTGTRLTWRVSGSAARADADVLTWTRLFATPPERWLLLAHQVLGVEGWLDLESTTSRHVDDLSAVDVLAAHALAAYLVEGRTELPEVLRAVAGGLTSPEALTSTLELDLRALEWRLARWLDENVLPSDVRLADLAGPALAVLATPDDPLWPLALDPAVVAER